MKELTFFPGEMQSHSDTCLCPDCLFVGRIADAEAYIHFCENRLASAGPRWRAHWQKRLSEAWAVLRLWQRHYQADRARMEAHP